MREMVIKESDGIYYAYTPRGEQTAGTMEQLLTKLDPGAPPAKLLASAEILEYLLGPPRHGLVVDGLADTRDR